MNRTSVSMIQPQNNPKEEEYKDGDKDNEKVMNFSPSTKNNNTPGSSIMQAVKMRHSKETPMKGVDVVMNSEDK